ncbi:TetR/AcrR family transcriptional regulator [Aeromicrobium ginsengisoli]|uniref:TetR/AcrR family transcriptional regulator n=1 Tax=Aeromicrobium ginsengisoli TaxID=363867 RepID=A0A5M4F9E7_9ACTN|nr:TetR/AcrR family transcriptional regulator [Aeromicrobium ginsengisoli]KAA1394337.1 TetR/AcrR family transcriptional regulator [Aeromicrobium ginsengisoli]
MDRRPGRPRSLSLELIVDAVLEDGIATFSMPSIAARLGVAHSGLYRYVTDRDELLVAAIEKAALSVDWPEPDLPWRQLLGDVARAVWTICERYPGYDVVALSPPKWPERIVGQVTPYISSLHKQGFTIEDATVAVQIAGNLALTTSVKGTSGSYPLARINGDRTATQRHDWHDRILDIVLDGLGSRLLA